jgi:hypothetical protein
MSDNIIDLAEEAKKKGKFSLSDAIKNRAYPEKAVDIYIDGASAFELAAITDAMKDIDPALPEHEHLNKEAEALSKKIMDSRLTFHMRGVGQGTVEEITKQANEKFGTGDEAQEGDWIRFYLCALIASNVVKISDVEGNEDESVFTTDDIMDLRDAIPVDSWEILIDTMQKLTLASSYFDAATDAGFLPKS